jgi:hypothetical protein
LFDDDVPNLKKKRDVNIGRDLKNGEKKETYGTE